MTSVTELLNITFVAARTRIEARKFSNNEHQPVLI